MRDRAALRRAVRRLQAAGYEVAVDPAALARHQRFAGDDDARLAAIERAAAAVDGADHARGRCRPVCWVSRLPYDDRRRRAPWHVGVGLSDFTAFGLAAGPARDGHLGRPGGDDAEDWQVDAPDDITTCLLEDLAQGGEGSGWRLPLSGPVGAPRAGGRLACGRRHAWGGNLSILAGLRVPLLAAPEDGGCCWRMSGNTLPHRAG